MNDIILLLVQGQSFSCVPDVLLHQFSPFSLASSNIDHLYISIFITNMLRFSIH